MTFEPQLVPTLREGIDVIKMILYKELKSLLISRHKDRKSVNVNLLTAAVVNALFGVPHSGPAVETVSRADLDTIERTCRLIAAEFDHLRIPLTDALRIQFICDDLEGFDSSAMLEKAERYEILIVERDVPLPGAFMGIVRSFGRAYGILDPLPSTAPQTTQMTQNGATGG